MAIRARENVWGAWAFLIGIILAVLVGVANGLSGGEVNQYVLWILFTLGLAVGYFVSEKDVQTFLLASVSVVIVSYVGISGMSLNSAIWGVWAGKPISSIFASLLTLFVPATIIVALKTVFSISNIRTTE